MLPYAMLEIRYYVAENGSQPFAKWFADVEPVARAKVPRAIARMEQGNLSDVKPVGGGVLEYRLVRTTMAKTKSFKELVQGQVKTGKRFADALLREGVDAMLSGDVETGKTILRDYIKATVGFEKLGQATDTPPKSLIRMFGPRGNPQAKNLFSVIGYLQKRAGVQLHVSG